jgi:enamine deaminase RidA (YjgF/YER057c/UK114 family)
MTWYVVDKAEYLRSLSRVGAVYREVMGKNFPAMAVVEVKGLIEDGARLEIETTAVIPER